MTAYQSANRHHRAETRQPRRIAQLRGAIGLWLLLLMAVLYSTGHGGQWAWLLAVGTGVHWVWAYRLFGLARRGQPTRGEPGMTPGT